LDTKKYTRDKDIGCSVCLAPKKNVFVAWGKNECPDKGSQSLLYAGQVAASHYAYRGSGGNAVCLHNNPQSVKGATNRYQHHQSRLYGVEYWQNYNQYKKNYQKDAACAVCTTNEVGATYVQWGRQTCAANYKEGTVNHTVVYKGMIHSTRHDWQGKSTYECVHMDRDAYLTSANDPEKSNGRHEDGNRWYTTELMTGSIQETADENGYRTGYELPCVVCRAEPADAPPPTPAPTRLSTNTEFKTLVDNFNNLQKKVQDLEKKLQETQEATDEDIQTVIQTFNGKNNDRVNDITKLENTIIQAIESGHNVSETDVPERTSPTDTVVAGFEPTIEVDEGEVKISIVPGKRLKVNDGGEDDEILTANEVKSLVQEHVKNAFKKMYDGVNPE
jgi:hypothetical protein